MVKLNRFTYFELFLVSTCSVLLANSAVASNAFKPPSTQPLSESAILTEPEGAVCEWLFNPQVNSNALAHDLQPAVFHSAVSRYDEHHEIPSTLDSYDDLPSHSLRNFIIHDDGNPQPLQPNINNLFALTPTVIKELDQHFRDVIKAFTNNLNHKGRHYELTTLFSDFGVNQFKQFKRKSRQLLLQVNGETVAIDCYGLPYRRKNQWLIDFKLSADPYDHHSLRTIEVKQLQKLLEEEQKQIPFINDDQAVLLPNSNNEGLKLYQLVHRDIVTRHQDQKSWREWVYTLEDSAGHTVLVDSAENPELYQTLFNYNFFIAPNDRYFLSGLLANQVVGDLFYWQPQVKKNQLHKLKLNEFYLTGFVIQLQDAPPFKGLKNYGFDFLTDLATYRILENARPPFLLASANQMTQAAELFNNFAEENNKAGIPILAISTQVKSFELAHALEERKQLLQEYQQYLVKKLLEPEQRHLAYNIVFKNIFEWIAEYRRLEIAQQVFAKNKRQQRQTYNHLLEQSSRIANPTPADEDLKFYLEERLVALDKEIKQQSVVYTRQSEKLNQRLVTSLGNLAQSKEYKHFYSKAIELLNDETHDLEATNPSQVLIHRLFLNRNLF